jgi:hypothetical protein
VPLSDVTTAVRLPPCVYASCTSNDAPEPQSNVPAVANSPDADGDVAPVRSRPSVDDGSVSKRTATPLAMPASAAPTLFWPAAKPSAPPMPPVAAVPRGSRWITIAMPSPAPEEDGDVHRIDAPTAKPSATSGAPQNAVPILQIWARLRMMGGCPEPVVAKRASALTMKRGVDVGGGVDVGLPVGAGVPVPVPVPLGLGVPVPVPLGEAVPVAVWLGDAVCVGVGDRDCGAGREGAGGRASEQGAGATEAAAVRGGGGAVGANSVVTSQPRHATLTQQRMRRPSPPPFPRTRTPCCVSVADGV